MDNVKKAKSVLNKGNRNFRKKYCLKTDCKNCELRDLFIDNKGFRDCAYVSLTRIENAINEVNKK